MGYRCNSIKINLADYEIHAKIGSAKKKTASMVNEFTW